MRPRDLSHGRYRIVFIRALRVERSNAARATVADREAASEFTGSSDPDRRRNNGSVRAYWAQTTMHPTSHPDDAMISPTHALRALAVITALGSAASPGSAQPLATDPAASPPPVRVEIRDLTPRFLRFYEAAVAEKAGPDRRWTLWKEHYDFAALPPVPQRDSMARALLDTAWARYPSVLERIRGGAAAMTPDPTAALAAVASRLGADTITVRLTVYVGALERNAFTFGSPAAPQVVFPVEPDAEWRSLVLSHEFAHAVHMRVAGLAGGWERSIGRSIVEEGVAMRVAEALHPGRPAAAYVEQRSGWLAEAMPRRDAILRGLLPVLRASDSETVMRFTMGRGTTGVEREAYLAGWLVVGHLMERGRSLAEIARVPEDQLPALVEAAIREMIAGAAR
jgi:hypothetical protein